MKPDVLVLSSLYDFSIDIVLRYLTTMGVQYVRLNVEQLPELRVSFDPLTRAMTVKGLGIGAAFDANLKSIWYRSAVFLRNSLGDRTLAEQLERSQWNAFLRSLMVFDNARWMNHPANTYMAETKPYQLLAAARCGFCVPHTIIGNDVIEVQQQFHGDLALKSIDTVYLRENRDAVFAYTSIVCSGTLSDKTFHQAPVTAQQFLSPKTDLRVTVVGSAVFAYKILANGHAAPGDWRLHKREELTYAHYILPEIIKNRCVAICSNLKLPFGAIDLIESDGEFFFIEINPTGEWAWLPDAESTIGEAIALWLAGNGQRDA